MSIKDKTGKEYEDIEGNGKGLSYDLTYKDVVDVLEIIDHSEAGELHLEVGDLKLTVRKRGSSPLKGAP